MKLPCEIARDLIPLYTDEVCSPASREAVREHLKECPDCAALADSALRFPESQEKPEPLAEEHAVIKSLRKVRRRWKRSLLVLPLLLLAAVLGLMGWNQYRGEGICFTNLDDIWICSRFLSAVEKQDWDKAASCINYDVLYESCQEVINLTVEDYLGKYREVSIGEDTYMVHAWFEQEYLTDTSDVYNTWGYLILNGIDGALIPEDVFREVTSGMEKQLVWSEGNCYMADAYWFYRLETRWGSFMVPEWTYERLIQTECDELELYEFFYMLTPEMYAAMRPEMERLAQEYVAENQEAHQDIIGLSREEFAAYMQARYVKQLRTFEEQGCALENLGFREAYYTERWNISLAVRVSDGELANQGWLTFYTDDGKICMAGWTYAGEFNERYDEVLDALHPGH